MNIAIVTAAFPYHPGEQFIETEISFWENTAFEHVYLLPCSSNGKARAVPPNIAVDTSLSSKKFNKFIFAAKAITSPYFLNEIKYLKKINKLTKSNALTALKATAQVIHCENSLSQWLEKKNIDIIYTYWNDVAAYAACLAKRKGKVRQVISRAHGFDVYEFRRPEAYMPLKRQFVSDMDKVFVLSKEAFQYMQNQYGLQPNQLEIGRLGVVIPEASCKPTGPNSLHLVSVSSCVPVKRIDKIINAIKQFSIKNPVIQVKWTHLGDGPLRESLEKQAQAKLGPQSNVNYSFVGYVTNEEVNRFYQTNSVDIFINTSESEGIPVSIMEAMAAGVPTIAPDVGGVSELVNQENGHLLSNSPNVDEVEQSINLMHTKSKDSNTRNTARNTIQCKFSADQNYNNFIQSLQHQHCRDSLPINDSHIKCN